MSEWAHEAICTVAIWYIRKHCAREERWLYTRLSHLHNELKTVVLLGPRECPIVSCYIERGHWFAITSSRLITFDDTRQLLRAHWISYAGAREILNVVNH